MSAEKDDPRVDAVADAWFDARFYPGFRPFDGDRGIARQAAREFLAMFDEANRWPPVHWASHDMPSMLGDASSEPIALPPPPPGQTKCSACDKVPGNECEHDDCPSIQLCTACKKHTFDRCLRIDCNNIPF